ncbi:MAG: sodium:proton antiporter [Oscillospiraceae bacterium]|nr:sodium:proton antiporter [Oscillospiraceae bacterium]
MDIIILLLFVCILLACVLTGTSIVLALAAGYVFFALFALKKGFSLKQVLSMSMEGIKTVSTILFTFLLIGVLTALWRAGGTIAAIVSYSAGIIRPEVFILLTFLLCCLVSFLTGTAFGTSATMGAICVTIGHALGASPLAVGGAVLGGAYFGDRCSPVSTSALLTATVTGTDLYGNIRRMLKSAVLPFLLTCGTYLVLGFLLPAAEGNAPDVRQIFEGEFHVGVITVIPAVLILVCALLRANVKISMAVSILSSAFVCIFCQKQTVGEILRYALFGFTAKDPALSAMMNGGGIVSMIRVTAIVCISSLYAGIFRKTGLLCPVTRLIGLLSKKLSTFAVILIVSVVTGAVSCNQTLSIMLTEQLCSHLEQDKERLALYLENSAVVVVPLLPWTVACSVSLTSAGAPIASFPLAFFLILLPLWSLLTFKKVGPSDP